MDSLYQLALMGSLATSATLVETTASPSVVPVRTFHGYVCTEDCSGHQAGYDWATDRGITDPDICGGASNSFIEGCRAAAGEHGDSEEDDDADQSEGGLYE